MLRKCGFAWRYEFEHEFERSEGEEEEQEGDEGEKRVMLDVWKVERPD